MRLRTYSSAVVCLVLLSGVAAAEEIRIAYAGPQEGSVWRGVQQGLKEANILGEFMGQKYVLEAAKPEKLKGREYAAVLLASDPKTIRSVAKDLSEARVPVFNVNNVDNDLREECIANLFHVAPSNHMKADAEAQWKKKSSGGEVQALAWHSDFKKFAARDLNNRFREEHGVAMDGDAWAGWAAVKMISEAVARTQSTEPGDLTTYLREQMEFDGQKGAPHSFRENGQLRQPLLIVENGKLVAEAPVRGVVDPDDLDTLGLATCRQ